MPGSACNERGGRVAGLCVVWEALVSFCSVCWSCHPPTASPYSRSAITLAFQLAPCRHKPNHRPVITPINLLAYIWLNNRNGIMAHGNCESFIDKKKEVRIHIRSWRVTTMVLVASSMWGFSIELYYLLSQRIAFLYSVWLMLHNSCPLYFKRNRVQITGAG